MDTDRQIRKPKPPKKPREYPIRNCADGAAYLAKNMCGYGDMIACAHLNWWRPVCINAFDDLKLVGNELLCKVHRSL